MANYQYGTSPRKIEPEYKKVNVKKKTVQPNRKKVQNTQKNKKVKSKEKKKISFEIKFFINSMAFFSIIFAIIACQALVEQRYKEKESLKQEYSELLASSNMALESDEDIRALASQYGMQTKSATLIDLEISDYIESSTDKVEVKNESFYDKIINWFKGLF